MKVTKVEFRNFFQVLSQTMMTKVNKKVLIPVNPNEGTEESRVTKFTRMNPPKFHCSNVEEDPQEFIDEVYKVLMIMGVL